MLQAVKRTLDAHVTLMNGGRKPLDKERIERAYSLLEGLHTQGDLLSMLEQTTLFDRYLRESREAGKLNMNLLFYGPPGRGKVEVPPEVRAGFLIEQIEAVRTIIKEHYQSTRGECSQFGAITGYTYWYHFDHGIRFSVDGAVTDLHVDRHADPRMPQSALVVGGKKITGGLLSKIAHENQE